MLEVKADFSDCDPIPDFVAYLRKHKEKHAMAPVQPMTMPQAPQTPAPQPSTPSPTPGTSAPAPSAPAHPPASPR